MGGGMGQLGHGDTQNQPIPKRIQALERLQVKALAGGWSHSAAVTETGDLYVWGGGQDGQLGLDPGLLDEGRILATPTPLPIKSGMGGAAEVTQVSLGRVHSACVTRSGALYTWGMGHKGRLGHGGSDHEPQ